MNATINILGGKLIALMDDVHFRYDFDKALDSPEHLLAIGEHNIREYEKFEAMGEERKGRIWNLMATVLASALQEEAIEKCGNTDGGSIRQVLRGWFNQPENIAFWGRLKRTAKLALPDFSLTEEQNRYITDLLDELPNIIIDSLAKMASHLRLLPRSSADSIAVILADMIMEAKSCYR